MPENQADKADADHLGPAPFLGGDVESDQQIKQPHQPHGEIGQIVNLIALGQQEGDVHHEGKHNQQRGSQKQPDRLFAQAIQNPA